MSIEWFRDLVISINGVLLIVVLIFVAVLLYSLYRRVRSILDSAKITARAIGGVSSYVAEEAVKPMIQLVSFVQGIRQGVDTVTKIFKKKQGGKDD